MLWLVQRVWLYGYRCVWKYRLRDAMAAVEAWTSGGHNSTQGRLILFLKGRFQSSAPALAPSMHETWWTVVENEICRRKAHALVALRIGARSSSPVFILRPIEDSVICIAKQLGLWKIGQDWSDWKAKMIKERLQASAVHRWASRPPTFDLCSRPQPSMQIYNTHGTLSINSHDTSSVGLLGKSLPVSLSTFIKAWIRIHSSPYGLSSQFEILNRQFLTQVK